MRPPLLAAPFAPAFLGLSQPYPAPSSTSALYQHDQGLEQQASDSRAYAWPTSWASHFRHEDAAKMPWSVEDVRAESLSKHAGRALSNLGIPPSPLNLAVYIKARQIKGRRIALGLSGVLIDCQEASRSSQSIFQEVHLKEGVQAMLHGLKRDNALTLYTHDPAIRVARIFERFQILQDIFMDSTWSGEPVTSDEELLSYGNVICFENQLSVITDILKKSMEGKTLLGWESAILRSLRLDTNEMLRLAYLKSRNIALALGQSAFDTVVSSNHAWKTVDKNDGSPMLLIPMKEETPRSLSIPLLVEALQDDRPGRPDKTLVEVLQDDHPAQPDDTLVGDQRSAARMSPQQLIQLPRSYPAPEVGEFKVALMRYSARIASGF